MEQDLLISKGLCASAEDNIDKKIADNSSDVEVNSPQSISSHVTPEGEGSEYNSIGNDNSNKKESIVLNNSAGKNIDGELNVYLSNDSNENVENLSKENVGITELSTSKSGNNIDHKILLSKKFENGVDDMHILVPTSQTMLNNSCKLGVDLTEDEIIDTKSRKSKDNEENNIDKVDHIAYEELKGDKNVILKCLNNIGTKSNVKDNNINKFKNYKKLKDQDSLGNSIESNYRENKIEKKPEENLASIEENKNSSNTIIESPFKNLKEALRKSSKNKKVFAKVKEVNDTKYVKKNREVNSFPSFNDNIHNIKEETCNDIDIDEHNDDIFDSPIQKEIDKQTFLSHLSLQIEKPDELLDNMLYGEEQSKTEQPENMQTFSKNVLRNRSRLSIDSDGTLHRLSIDTDEILPIQPEVVMSEGTDSELEDEIFEHIPKIQEIENQSNLPEGSSTVEYVTANNFPPQNKSNLALWQLHKVSLPKFVPDVEPPPWIRLTIPEEGYQCLSCQDVFYIESSLASHKERRTIWINFNCNCCNTMLNFYNRCTFNDHLREHIMKGHVVHCKSLVVKPLPIHLNKLLQPIVVPVPQSIEVDKKRNLKRKKDLKSRKNILSDLNHQIDSDNGESTLCHQNPEDLNTIGSPSKNRVRCYLCDKTFQNVRDLISHMKTDQFYSDQRVECRKCLLVLPSICAAKAHILTHPSSNSSNISVCPECGNKCEGPRDFVHHLNTCGHQFRRSGLLCEDCKVCFFRLSEDFIKHWIKEHCFKSYECLLCLNSFQSMELHKCGEHRQLTLSSSYMCLLTCPLCLRVIKMKEKETQEEIREHLSECRPQIINRVNYVFKSKFCTNAFRSKDELRAHHDREHRRDNHYRTKMCSLHHKVLVNQQQYFNGQEPRNAFITLLVKLSPEELAEARTRDVPTVSSVIDKMLFPDLPNNLEKNKLSLPTKAPKNYSNQQKERLLPRACYRCGYTYGNKKDIKTHRITCEGESAERLCQTCGVSAVGEEFYKHCSSHILEGHIICIYCNGATFSSLEELQHHLQIHAYEHFIYPALCPFCPYTMVDANTAFNHLLQKHNLVEVPRIVEFTCERCDRKFHGERGLTAHMARCNARPDNLGPGLKSGKFCQLCKKCVSNESFGKHIMSHLEEGLLVCGLCCGRVLPSSVDLLLHLEGHIDSLLIFPWSCPICTEVELSDSHSALIHVKEDHGFGNIKCPHCEMEYNFILQLHRHISIVHRLCLFSKRRYICWICQAYDNVKKETLMNHFRVIHNLTSEEVDEKAMIRTRGQGTMPSATFIPTKRLGSKENSKITYNFDNQNVKISFNTNNNKIKDGSRRLNLAKIEIKTNQENEINGSSFQDVIGKRENTTINLNDVKHEQKKHKTFQNYLDYKLKNRAKVVVERLSEGSIEANQDMKIRSKIFCCDICKFSTNSKSKFDRHYEKHKMEIEDFVCDTCGQSFVVEISLKRHMFFAHSIKTKVPLTTEQIQKVLPNKQTSRPRIVKKFKIVRRNFSQISHNKINNASQITRSKKSKRRRNSFNRSRKKRKNNNSSNFQAKKIMLDHQAEIIKVKSDTIQDRTSVKDDTVQQRIPAIGDSIEERTSQLQCSVCFEEFPSSIKLYSHLRTHGMAFLKAGLQSRIILAIKDDTNQTKQLKMDTNSDIPVD